MTKEEQEKHEYSEAVKAFVQNTVNLLKQLERSGYSGLIDKSKLDAWIKDKLD